MIISESPNHKIDVTHKEDGFMLVTAFHLNLGSNEWKVKVLGFSPEAQVNLFSYMLNIEGYKEKAAKP